MKTFSDIIDKLGGPTEAARKLGTSQQNASQMKRLNSISARYWPRVVQLLPSVTMSKLAKLYATRRGAK
mgnify:CR=1 FL=1